MEKYDWKKTIKGNITRMRIVGIWPGGNESYKLDLYTLWSVLSITVLTFGHAFFQMYNLVFIFHDLQAVLGTMYVTLSELVNLLKAYLTIKNMKILKQLMVTLNSDLFQPRNEKQLIMVSPDLRFWKLVGYYFWTSITIAIFFWSTYPVFDHSIKNHRLPFLAWYPYNTNVSPNYEITYVYQVLGVTFTATTALTVDTLIAALHMYIGAQFDILCDNIRNMYEPNENIPIDFDKRLLSFMKFVSDFMNIVVAPFTSEFFALLAFLAAIIVQIFVYCWFGNLVEVKSSQIPYAVFESNWLNTPEEHKKLMIIFVERNQKPLKVMALDLFFLNLDTFMKAYFTVKNMKILKQLMVTLNSDLFQPRNEKQLIMIKPDLRFWKLVGYYFWTSITIAIFFWSTYPVFDHSIKNHRLPFLAWYPYNTNVSPYFEITYVYQVLGVTVTAVTSIAIDILIAALHMYVGAQFDILCDNLRNIFYEHCKNFCNWIIFIQFFISAMTIGITMFLLTTSSQIPYAVFESNWTNTSNEHKKLLIFFVERNQKPLKVMALDLFFLNLDTFM
ncbi:7tm 6 domain containing protein, partial [Asbolus verrucosus]